jgi:hypothetical protein
MVLRKNNFTFNGDHYIQINGTDMGTKMAPSYTNTFIGKFEKQLLEWPIERPLSWYRSIDDVDVTKQSAGGTLTERDSQISLQASMPSE